MRSIFFKYLPTTWQVTRSGACRYLKGGKVKWENQPVF